MNVTSVAFSVGLVTSLSLLILSLVGIFYNRLQFWPPPKLASWQYIVFWSLFRLFFLAIVVLCVIDFQGFGKPSFILSVIGWTLSLIGFLVAVGISAQMGWSNAHGEATGLITIGLFAYSRNPIYVASIVGMFGLAMAVNSSRVNSLLAIWATLYLLAPIAEEPWLKERYGDSYTQYCETVSRYFGRR